MPDPKVVVPYKPFVMQEGMTLKDVNNAPNLSAEAKKHIAIFDADGNGTFSKREADVFNATSIKTRVWGTSLNTVYKNGEVKSATIQGDVASLKYAPEGEIKPTEVPVENVVKNDKKEVKTQTAPSQQTTKSRPLPALTRLTFNSEQDRIAFNIKLDFYTQKYDKAAEAIYAKFEQSKKANNAKYEQAKKIIDAMYGENSLDSKAVEMYVKAGHEYTESVFKAIDECRESDNKAWNEYVESVEKAIQVHCM